MLFSQSCVKRDRTGDNWRGCKDDEGRERLTFGERLRELGCSASRADSWLRILPMHTDIFRPGAKRMGPEYFHWWDKGQWAKLECRKFPLNVRKKTTVSWQSTWRRLREVLQSPSQGLLRTALAEPVSAGGLDWEVSRGCFQHQPFHGFVIWWD